MKLKITAVFAILLFAFAALAQTAPAPQGSSAPKTEAQEAQNKAQTKEELLKYMQQTRKDFLNSVKGLSEAQLKFKAAPDKWSVNEILAHLADTEIVVGFRMRLILDAPGTPVVAVDQDSWVTSGHYEKRDPRKSVEQFRVVREANLALLKSLTPQQWKHYGMHSERGQETIEHIVRMYAGHDINHLQQIERILSKKPK